VLIKDNPRDAQLIYEILGKDAENQFDLKRVVLLTGFSERTLVTKARKRQT
jgi:hypothetical protein